MRVSTEIEEATPEEVAWFVKSHIEGIARGFAPTFLRMRLPRLEDSGIRFAYEPDHGGGHEDFATPLATYERQWGDCDDLVIYKLCELWSPTVRFRTERDPSGQVRLPCAVDQSAASCSCEWRGESMHVTVRLRNGDLYDPAVQLGAPWQ